MTEGEVPMTEPTPDRDQWSRATHDADVVAAASGANIKGEGPSSE
jgi:hypothetical protein